MATAGAYVALGYVSKTERSCSEVCGQDEGIVWKAACAEAEPAVDAEGSDAAIETASDTAEGIYRRRQIQQKADAAEGR